MIRELMQYIVHMRPYIFTIGIIVAAGTIKIRFGIIVKADFICLLYTSDAADEL